MSRRLRRVSAIAMFTFLLLSWGTIALAQDPYPPRAPQEEAETIEQEPETGRAGLGGGKEDDGVTVGEVIFYAAIGALATGGVAAAGWGLNRIRAR